MGLFRVSNSRNFSKWILRLRHWTNCCLRPRLYHLRRDLNLGNFSTHFRLSGPVTFLLNSETVCVRRAMDSDCSRFSSRSTEQPKESKAVSIGDDTWIGAYAIVLPGVSIASHAIVAAGAVVTRDVAEWQIVAGSPAVVIGSRLDAPGAAKIEA